MASLIVAKLRASINKTAIQKSLFVCTILLIVPFALLQAQKTPRILYGEPCCGITEIDAIKGVVTAKDHTTGQVFQFEVDSRKLLGSLKQGQQLWLNTGRDKVSLDGADPCCTIVGSPGLSPAVKMQLDPADPCCSVTSIDPVKGIVTARENATGQVFQFEVDSRKLLGSLKQGQQLWLNTGRDKVSLDGADPCCNIVGSPGLSPAVKIQVDPADPCCGITSIDHVKGVVTAKDHTTDQVFQFEVDSRKLLGSLKQDQQLWLNTGRDKVSLDGGTPCCTIVNESGLVPVADVQPDPADPCCGVVSVDAGRGLVTARHLTTGRTFQFTADNTAALKTGDGVVADLSAGRVTGVAGISSSSATFEPNYGDPCCSVVSVEPDAGDPCCNVVTIRNSITGQLAHFSAPREIIIGALGITNTAWIENSGEYAVVQSPATESKVSTYSYPLHMDGGSASTSAASPATSGSENEAWILTANPDLRGATGRLVLSVPDDEASLIFHILKPGTQERINTWYGSGSSAFLPGTVDVAMRDIRIVDVPLVKGMDTRIRAGVLSVSFDGSYIIINERGEQVFSACCSEKRKVVLPPGKYRLELPTGQQQGIVIEDGKVTEF